MAVITKLRDIKYRGRIPVESGYTLYGIMDETGQLSEGEVYVSPLTNTRLLLSMNVGDATILYTRPLKLTHTDGIVRTKVVTESSPGGGRRVLVQDRIVVTRSPALHTGDVQIVRMQMGVTLLQASNLRDAIARFALRSSSYSNLSHLLTAYCRSMLLMCRSIHRLSAYQTLLCLASTEGAISQASSAEEILTGICMHEFLSKI